MFCRAVKKCLVLLALFFLVFISCTTVRRYDLPDKVDYGNPTEIGQVSTHVVFMVFEERYNFFYGFILPQFIFPLWSENYCIEMSIDDVSYLLDRFNKDEDAMLYMYIDECYVTLPSNNVINLMDNITLVNYSYTGRDFKVKSPPKTLRNVQPQYTEDGKKILYLDSIVDKDGVRIEFNAKIPSYANALRMEYTLTVVWENQGEVKRRYDLVFKKKTKKAYLF